MSEIVEYERVDRSEWDPGPWDAEPHDRVEWRHEGLACLMLRGRLGAWCGYVGVPPDHPWHGLGYDAISPYPSVHGGLTYADECAGHICHIPQPGEPEHVWWLGFDCGHAGDLMPGMVAIDRKLGSLREWPDDDLWKPIYKPVGYVTAEVNNLAEQIRASA